MLKFESEYLRDIFYNQLVQYLKQIGIQETTNKSLNFSSVTKSAVTKEKRQAKLEMFFRVVFAQVGI